MTTPSAHRHTTDMKLPLASGTRIICRVFATLPLSRADIPNIRGKDWMAATPPKRMLASGEVVVSDLRMRYRRCPLDDEWPGLKFDAAAEQSIEAYAVADSVVTIEAVSQWTIEKEGLFFDPVQYAHQWPEYKTLLDWFARQARSILTPYWYGETNSVWASNMALIIPPKKCDVPDAVQDILRLAVSRDGEEAAVLDTDEIIGAMSWNGGVFYLHSTESQEMADSAILLKRAACCQWHAIDEGAAAAIRMMGASMDGKREVGEKVLEDLRRVLLRLYWTLSVLDLTRLSPQQSEMALSDTIQKGWRSESHQETSQRLLDRVAELYALRASAQEGKRQHRLNIIVAGLGVLGIAGTTAAVLTTLDFGNKLVGFVGRGAWILGSTMILLGVLIVFLGGITGIIRRKPA